MTPPAPTSTLTIAGEAIELLPHRAAFWPARRTLIAADLHLGKCETLRAAGMPIPAGVIERDLARLAAAVAQTRATRILIVGDLIHHGSGLTPELIDLVAAFRRTALPDIELGLIRGNHDRSADLILKQWVVTPLPDAYLDAPFGFAHDPADGLVPGALCTWYGHIHPLCRIGTRGDGLSIPCFMVDADHVLLPAFSQFTRGIAIAPPPPSARVFGIADGRVIDIPARPLTPRERPRKPSCLNARPG